MHGTYTTKELAEKLNKSDKDIYRIKQKYSHLFLPEHCITNKVSGRNILLWDELVIKQMEDLFLLESKKAKDHISNWNTKKELAMILNIKPAKLDQYFNEIEETLLVGTDYGYWQQNGVVTQRWSKTGIARLCEYIEYLHGYSHQTKDSESVFTHSDPEKENIPSFTRSDFDKAIADLESQITELKAKYPEFVKTPHLKRSPLPKGRFKGVTNFTYATKIRYQAQVSLGHKKVHIGSFLTDIEAAQAYDLKIVELRGEGGITNFPVEGVKTNVLFPDYPATKRHEVTESAPKPIETVQLTIATDDDATDENLEETVFDRMRAFALENGIEIKTMKVA